MALTTVESTQGDSERKERFVKIVSAIPEPIVTARDVLSKRARDQEILEKRTPSNLTEYEVRVLIEAIDKAEEEKNNQGRFYREEHESHSKTCALLDKKNFRLNVSLVFNAILSFILFISIVVGIGSAK